MFLFLFLKLFLSQQKYQVVSTRKSNNSSTDYIITSNRIALYPFQTMF